MGNVERTTPKPTAVKSPQSSVKVVQPGTTIVIQQENFNGTPVQVEYARIESPPSKKDGKKKSDEKDPIDKTAKLFFNQLDTDKNGSITSEEWARSRRLKPRFEEVGIDLSKPMDAAQFASAYRKAYGDS